MQEKIERGMQKHSGAIKSASFIHAIHNETLNIEHLEIDVTVWSMYRCNWLEKHKKYLSLNIWTYLYSAELLFPVA